VNPRWILEQVQKALAAVHERLDGIEARLKALEEKRGPGRPPKAEQ